VIRIQSEIKRAILRQIVEGAKLSGSPVKSALIATQAAAADSSFKKGRLTISVSGNGQSASFQIGANGFTQDVFVGLTEELINVLDDTVAAGYAKDDASDSNSLFSAMCADDRLVGIRTQMGDFTGLRFPVTR
jgi:hypothetical protein